MKKGGVIILTIICIIIMILISFINYKINLNQEANLFQPLGTMVTVNEHDMHVYGEGEGETTFQMVMVQVWKKNNGNNI